MEMPASPYKSRVCGFSYVLENENIISRKIGYLGATTHTTTHKKKAPEGAGINYFAFCFCASYYQPRIVFVSIPVMGKLSRLSLIMSAVSVSPLLIAVMYRGL